MGEIDTAEIAASSQLTPAELWRCVDETVLNVLLPALRPDEEWARAVAVQLVGLARYAAGRADDEGDARAAELAATLDTLAGNELVDACWTTGDPADTACCLASIGSSKNVARRS